MKAINLNGPEFYPQDHRTRKAYHKLISLRNQLYFNQIDFLTFVIEVEKIIFNDLPTNDLKYLNDGLTNGCYLTIIKELLKSCKGGSLYRLKSDLLTVY